jgi:2C-methyl-D-erythritol 2,4-cyclodiphosphate synthase
MNDPLNHAEQAMLLRLMMKNTIQDNFITLKIVAEVKAQQLKLDKDDKEIFEFIETFKP